MTFNPVVCQNCTNQNIATVYPLFEVMLKNGVPIIKIYEKLGVELQCCKTSLIAHIDYMKDLEC